MPRAFYEQKNRFCWNSNQSDWAYSKLLFYWLYGETFSDLASIMANEQPFFDKVVARINKGLLKEPLEAEPPQPLSRQSCHNIINQVAERLVDDQAQGTLRAMKSFSMKLRDHPGLKGYPGVSKLFGWLEKTGMLKGLQETAAQWTKEDLEEGWAYSVYALASNTLEYNRTKMFKVPGLDVIIDPIVVHMLQERFKKLRGFDRSRMTTHIAFYFAIKDMPVSLYKVRGLKPRQPVTQMSESQINSLKIDVAMMAWMRLLKRFEKRPVRDRAGT